MISPWLNAGIDSQPYQNTSVVRFLVDRLNAEFGTGLGYLTQRDANAPRLDSAFGQFGRNDMRKDCPERIEPYQFLPSPDPTTGTNAIPYSLGTLTAWNPPTATRNATPVSYMQELLNIYVAALPGHPDSGTNVPRNFATNADVDGYIEERRRAAEKFYADHPEHARA